MTLTRQQTLAIRKRVCSFQALLGVALAALWFTHAISPIFDVPSLLFLTALSVAGIFFMRLGMIVVGVFTLVFAIWFAFVANAIFSQLNFVAGGSVVGDILAVFVIVCIAGSSSFSLLVYGNYYVWQLLGSLGVFVLFVVFELNSQFTDMAICLVVSAVATFGWLLGLVVGAAVRQDLEKSSVNRLEDD